MTQIYVTFIYDVYIQYEIYVIFFINYDFLFCLLN